MLCGDIVRCQTLTSELLDDLVGLLDRLELGEDVEEKAPSKTATKAGGGGFDFAAGGGGFSFGAAAAEGGGGGFSFGAAAPNFEAPFGNDDPFVPDYSPTSDDDADFADGTPDYSPSGY